jgi:hypothetical protein
VAAIMRRCAEQSVDEQALKEHEDRIRTQVADTHRAAIGRVEDAAKQEVDRLKRQHAQELATIEAFESFLGESVLRSAWKQEENWLLVRNALAGKKINRELDDIERTCHEVLRIIGRQAGRTETEAAAHA